MKSYKALFSMITMAVILSACAKYGTSTYHYSHPKRKKQAQCLSQCYSRHKSCTNSCTNTEYKCYKKAYKKTKVAFSRYVHQQEVAGKPVARDFNSFFDPLQCKKITCDCADDYMLCEKVCLDRKPV